MDMDFASLSSVLDYFCARKNECVLDTYRGANRTISTTAFRESIECLSGTRTSILADLEKWITGVENTVIFWLTGASGIGKTTVAHTLYGRASKRALATYFFFSGDSTRNGVESLVVTLAYQIHLHLPPLHRSLIPSLLRQFRASSKQSLYTQFDNLILRPLRELIESGYFSHADSPRLIIIDGLDECLDQSKQLEVIDMLLKVAEARMPFRFLLSSRTDSRIQQLFTARCSEAKISQATLDDASQSDLDIRAFLLQSFHECRATHPFADYLPADWPSGNDIEYLVRNSNGSFIYAATLIKFIDSPRHLPDARLEGVIKLQVDGDHPSSHLDALYRHILRTSSDSDRLMRILALIAYVNNYLSLALAEAILQIPAADCERLLLEIPSLVTLSTQNRSVYITVQHTSFLDFLRDRVRSQEYGVCMLSHCTQIIQACVSFIIRSKFNQLIFSILRLPLGMTDDFVEPLGEWVRAEAAIICLRHLSERSQFMGAPSKKKRMGLGHGRFHGCWTAHQRAAKKCIPGRKPQLFPPGTLACNIQDGTKTQYHCQSTYCMVLIYLAYLLPRAPKSDELLQRCQSHTFPPISMKFPKRSKQARQAIATYVERWSTSA